MRSQIIILAFVLFSLILSGCGSAAPNTNTGNAAAGNTNNPLETNKKAPEATTNNGPTLTPVFKAYCDAWVKKDEAALRKVYSQDTLKEFEADMKVEKTKSLLKFLEDDKVSGSPCAVTNEQINGDRAVAKIHSDKYPGGFPIVFVKENGEWKMTTRSPEIDSVRQPAANSNAGK